MRRPGSDSLDQNILRRLRVVVNGLRRVRFEAIPAQLVLVEARAEPSQRACSRDRTRFPKPLLVKTFPSYDNLVDSWRRASQEAVPDMRDAGGRVGEVGAAAEEGPVLSSVPAITSTGAWCIRKRRQGWLILGYPAGFEMDTEV